MVDWTRRLILYGSAAAVLWGGAVLHKNLNDAAASMSEHPTDILVHEGPFEPGALREGLEESGSTAEEVGAVLNALRKSGSAHPARKNDAFRIVRSTDGSFLHLTVTRGKERVLVTPQGGAFTARVFKRPIFDVERSVRGKIEGSLWLSMSRLGVPAEVIQEYADVFQWTIDFLTEPREGDDFSVVWNELRTRDASVWGRQVVAAHYDGKRTGRRSGILFAEAYYDEKGESLQRMFLRAPLNFRRISSYFSRRRWHPVLRRNRPHHGVDYAAPRGTPVVSVGAGVVTAVGNRGGFGKRVEIRHNSVYETLYGHLNGYARGLRAGERVRQGELIGYVGSTGLASGPHLHFQISKSGKWVNFLALKLPKTTSVQVKDKEAFAALRDRYLPLLAASAAESQSGSGR